MSDREQSERSKSHVIPVASAVLEDERVLEIVYDASVRGTSFAVSEEERTSFANEVILPSGERLVPYRPTNNLIRHNVVLLPSKPDEYGSSAELLAAVKAYLYRYVDLSPSFLTIASHYVLLTWLYDAFEELPYLRFQGDYGTGKTRALLVLGSICYKPFFASGASTVSPIFHTLDAFRGTLIFDEADFRFSDEKAEVVKILNNGNVKGMPVLRTMQDRNREFNPRAFQVYGPKIIAMRGSYDDRALESRFITEEMGRGSLRSDIPINLPPEHREEALQLRNKLLLYRFRNLRRVAPDPSLVLSGLEPRLSQVLVPLLSVMEDEESRASLRELAERVSGKVAAERGLSLEAQVLSVLRDLSEGLERPRIPLAQLTARFLAQHGAEYGGRASPRWMGQILRRRFHLSPVKSHGVYVVPLDDAEPLKALYSRYGLLDSEPQDADAISTAARASEARRVDEVDVGDVGGGATRQPLA